MKRILYLVSFIYIFTLSACLKDDRLILDPAKTHNLIEFANPSNIVKTGTTTALFVQALNLLPEGSLTYYVSYSGAEKAAPEDIVVDIEVGDANIITQYNVENSVSMVPLPAHLFSLTVNKVTIPKGQKRAAFVVNFKPSQFDFSKSYALPLVIKSASYGVISANFSKILVNISAMNKYDGLYQVEGLTPMLDLKSTTNTGAYPMVQELRTFAANSVAEWDNNVRAPYGYYHPIRANGSPNVYGSFSPVFVMNAQDEIVEVVNYYGQGNNGSLRSARIDPTGVNKWTIQGDSKVFEVKYVMVEDGVDRVFFHEKWTYKGLRP